MYGPFYSSFWGGIQLKPRLECPCKAFLGPYLAFLPPGIEGPLFSICVLSGFVFYNISYLTFYLNSSAVSLQHFGQLQLFLRAFLNDV